MSEQDRALEAFHRLLADGSAGGQAKVDALMALAQRTVLVPVWSQARDTYRTLVNADGQTALPVFTSRELLRAAGVRFGWVEPDGQVPHAEVGSRAALRHAVAQNLPFVVVDIASPHSLEILHAEIGPLLTPEARRESQGPYAGVGRLSSSMLQAVRATPPPGSVERGRVTPPPRSSGSSDQFRAPGTPERRPTIPQGSPPPPPPPSPSAQAARASEPAAAPPPPRTDYEDDLTQTGTRERPRRSTPLAHVLGERERPRGTPKRGHKRRSVPVGGRATRESARPPAMDDTGAYGAAAKAQRRQLDGRTPPAGGIRTPFVRRSGAPPDGAEQPPPETGPTPAGGVRRDSLQSDVPAGMGATPSAATQEAARILPLAQEPPASLLDAATAVLRDYPEVEWASFCFAARGDGGPAAAVALRVDDGFRQRVNEIVLGLRTAGAQEGSDVDVLLLDDPDAVRLARTEGVVFYPWRRSPSRPGT